MWRRIQPNQNANAIDFSQRQLDIMMAKLVATENRSAFKIIKEIRKSP